MSYIICISIIVRHINQIKSSLPIYLVKCHPSIELLRSRVKWEENYLRSYVVAVGKEWQCLFATILGPSSATLSSAETTPFILFSFSLQCGAWSRAILQLSSWRSSKQI